MSGFFKGQPTKTKTPKLPQCGKCGLYKNCISKKMEVSGTGKRKVLIVGAAPGDQEDRQGCQFLGDSGQLLMETLSGLDIELMDCWITNAVICKPPTPKVEPYMISCCRPNLLKTISALKPNVIVTMGKTPLESLLFREWKKNLGTLDRWVGWNIPSPQFKAYVCPTFHPAMLLKMNEDQQLMRLFQDHLKRAFQFEHSPVACHSLDNLKSNIEIITDPRKGRLRMKDLSKKKGTLAFDYETTGLKPDREGHRIVSVSFCLDGKDTFACMLGDNLLELGRVLRNPNLKKVASNIKFEERWTRAFFGHGVRGWVWDTMLAAHCLDNRSHITSIKFQSYIHLGIADYDSHISPYFRSKSTNGKNRIDEIDKEELLMYNGLDSLLEYLVMKKQRNQFK